MIFASDFDLIRTAMSVPRFLARAEYEESDTIIWQSVVVILVVCETIYPDLKRSRENGDFQPSGEPDDV